MGTPLDLQDKLLKPLDYLIVFPVMQSTVDEYGQEGRKIRHQNA
jgi:hypothetical protein